MDSYKNHKSKLIENCCHSCGNAILRDGNATHLFVMPLVDIEAVPRWVKKEELHDRTE